MKNFLFFLFACTILLTTACQTENLRGSGNIISDDRTGQAFSAITVSDAFEVTIHQGAEHAVIVSADDNIIDRITTNFVLGTLVVELNGNNVSFNNATLRVEITTPELTRVELNDAIRASLIDFSTDERLTLVVSDASRLDLSGSSPNLELDVNDASRIEGFAFTATECSANVNDASRLEIRVTDRLEGTASDASEIRFQGNPEVSVTTSDASRVVDAN